MNCSNLQWAWGMIRVCALSDSHSGECSWFPEPPSFDKWGNRLNPDGTLHNLDSRLHDGEGR